MGIADVNVQEKLLKNEDLTCWRLKIQQAIEQCRAAEIVKSQAREFQNTISSMDVACSINSIKLVNYRWILKITSSWYDKL